jgi:Ca2+-binding RTX toxin-like protein
MKFADSSQDALIVGTNLQDKIQGGSGNDTLFGRDGDDVLSGGSGKGYSDKVGGASNGDHDRLFGGAGNDTLSGMSGDDVVSGGRGDDVLFGNSGNDTVTGGQGHDILSGGRGSDWLSGGSGDDQVYGNSGNDYIVADAGNDLIVGGSGWDTIDFSGAQRSVSVNLNSHRASGFGQDKIVGIEEVVGSKFDDKLTGDHGSNALFGGDGDDILRGGQGRDVLDGGEGRDTFVFKGKDVFDAKGNVLGGEGDLIVDFGKGDTLDLRDAVEWSRHSFEKAVFIKDDGESSHVFLRSHNGEAQEVAILNNVHGMSAIEMWKAGMILG